MLPPTALPPTPKPPAALSPSALSRHAPPPPPVADTPDEPDVYTKKSPDWTGDSAGDRVLRINGGFFKYGTNDKTHAASILLSLIILLVLLVLIPFGMFATNHEFAQQVFTWLGSAFLFVAGVAVGRSTNLPKDESK